MIRRATLDDLDAIVALDRSAFAHDAWSPSMMRSELASPHTYYLVDQEAARIVGYAGLRAPDGSRDADVQTIGVEADGRTRGRGRRLLRYLLTEALHRRVREVFLDVRVDNDHALALYASEGFVEIGRRARYYQPDDVDAIVMRLDLDGWAAARSEEIGARGGSAGPDAPRLAPDSSHGDGQAAPVTPPVARSAASGSWCT